MRYRMPACSPAHIDAWLVEHPQQKSGKGCINFRDSDEIRLHDLAAVIRHAIEHPKE